MAPLAGTGMWRRQRKKGDPSLISMYYFDIMHHYDAPDRAEWTWSDMTLTKEFIPLTWTIFMRQHSDRIILQMKIVETKCKKMLKAPRKMGKKKKQLQLFHQNGRKRKQSRKTVKKGENVRVCHWMKINSCNYFFNLALSRPQRKGQLSDNSFISAILDEGKTLLEWIVLKKRQRVEVYLASLLYILHSSTARKSMRMNPAQLFI